MAYVADQHFEIFAKRSRESQERAQAEVLNLSEEVVPVNLDTAAALLHARYPSRRHVSRSSVSEFVEEITSLGYDRLEVLAQALSSGEERFKSFERDVWPNVELGFEKELVGPGSIWFSDVGAARLSLAVADANYREAQYDDDDDYFGLFDDARWPE